MTDLDTTNPVADDAARESAMGVDDQHDTAPEQLLDDDGNPVEAQPEPEDDEFDLDGEKLRLPKKVAPYLMRQADYTRKTQELAEQRRALEQQGSQQAQVEADEIKLHGRVQILSEQLAAFEQVDWAALTAENPEQAQQLRWQRDDIREAYQKAGGELQQAQQTRAARMASSMATAVQERERVLSDPDKGIKGWGPELGGKLTDYARGEFGISPQDIAQTTNPAAIKVLHRAYSLDQEVKSLRKQLGLQQQQTIKPAPRPGGSAGTGSRDIAKLDDGDFLKAAERKLREMGR